MLYAPVIGDLRGYAHRTLTITVSDTTVAIELDDADVRIVLRNTTQSARNTEPGRQRPAAWGKPRQLWRRWG